MTHPDTLAHLRALSRAESTAWGDFPRRRWGGVSDVRVSDAGALKPTAPAYQMLDDGSGLAEVAAACRWYGVCSDEDRRAFGETK